MQVILIKDVPKIGKKGELHEVSDGYARNYLLMRGLAVMASEGRLKTYSKEQAQKEAAQLRQQEAAQAVADKLMSAPLEIKAKAGKDGKLFGAITNGDIAQAVNSQFGELLDRRIIKPEAPIKSLGSHKASVKLHTKVKAVITINVVEG